MTVSWLLSNKHKHAAVVMEPEEAVQRVKHFIVKDGCVAALQQARRSTIQQTLELRRCRPLNVSDSSDIEASVVSWQLQVGSVHWHHKVRHRACHFANNDQTSTAPLIVGWYV